jgi:hypothetical protein
MSNRGRCSSHVRTPSCAFRFIDLSAPGQDGPQGGNLLASTDPQQRFHIEHHGNRRDGGLSRSSHVEVQRWGGGLISLSPSQIPESFGLFEPKIRHFIAMKRGIISTAELNIHINYV